eukprot:PITA_34039
MEDCKRAPSPFQSGAKLSVTCTSPKVDATLYHQLVGKLLYLANTCPDLSFVDGLIARFMKTHMKVIAKQLKEYFVIFEKSTAGYVFTLSSGPITWACKKQSAISLSSIEVAYRAVAEASKESLWLCQILSEFGFQKQHPITLLCDNKSFIQLCKYPVQHQRSKHIELHMHFIINLIHDHVHELQYCSTDDQVEIIFRKALTEAKFTKL